MAHVWSDYELHYLAASPDGPLSARHRPSVEQPEQSELKVEDWI